MRRLGEPELSILNSLGYRNDIGVLEFIDFFDRPFSVQHIVGSVENTESWIQDVWGLAVGTIPLVVLGFVKVEELR